MTHEDHFHILFRYKIDKQLAEFDFPNIIVASMELIFGF